MPCDLSYHPGSFLDHPGGVKHELAIQDRAAHHAGATGRALAIPGMLDDLVSRLAWVVAAGLDRSAEQRPGSDLGCALTMASPQGGGEDG